MANDEYEPFLAGLARRRAPAVARAEQLLAEDRYDAAEEAIRAVDSSIYGAVATAKLYRKRLEEMVAAGVTEANKSRVEAVFRRGLRSAQGAYPEPHTAIEADNYASGQADDRAELVGILGYDPGD
jgi:hypothetical protein